MELDMYKMLWIRPAANWWSKKLPPPPPRRGESGSIALATALVHYPIVCSQ